MGVESFLIASTVRLIVAQRLVRCLCSECKEKFQPSETLRQEWAESGIELEDAVFRSVGCASCRNTGYAGRRAILECLPIEDQIRPHINRRAEAGEVYRHAVAAGMQSMLEHGLARVRRGETSVEEILRVTMKR
jgi:type II secretory ATPase GspE/PulE/Tfp pilus assembly ATPase PilB-like protein